MEGDEQAEPTWRDDDGSSLLSRDRDPVSPLCLLPSRLAHTRSRTTVTYTDSPGQKRNKKQHVGRVEDGTARVVERPLAAVVHQGRASWSVLHPVWTAQASPCGEGRPPADLLDRSLPLLFAGTGAAYCQILDSIYGDVPMSRVKFTSKSVVSRTSHEDERMVH